MMTEVVDTQAPTQMFTDDSRMEEPLNECMENNSESDMTTQLVQGNS